MKTIEHLEVKMKESTKVALLEQSIAHINQTLIRIESRLDRMENKIDTNHTQCMGKIDSNFKWMLSVYFAGFGALFGMIAHLQHWF